MKQVKYDILPIDVVLCVILDEIQISYNYRTKWFDHGMQYLLSQYSLASKKYIKSTFSINRAN